MTLAGTRLFKVLFKVLASALSAFVLTRSTTCCSPATFSNKDKKGTCGESFLMFSAQCKPYDVRFVEIPYRSVYCLPPEEQLQKNLQTNFSKLGRTETHTHTHTQPRSGATCTPTTLHNTMIEPFLPKSTQRSPTAHAIFPSKWRPGALYAV